VVHSQCANGPSDFQLPEPWRGDIAGAPLLFVSSNPSWDPNVDNPTSLTDDDTIFRYYDSGFQDFPFVHLKDGNRRQKKVRFWLEIQSRAEELYERDVTAGRDYALTEVVHCKSRGERGVREAVDECTGRHFARLMELSPAVVVVVLGKVAKFALRIDAPAPFHDAWYGRERFVVTLPHTNARIPRKFTTNYSEDQLEPIRAALRAFTSTRPAK